MTKLADITSGQQNCKVLARITRLWDSKNMNSRAADPLISIDGVILDEDVHSLLAYFIFFQLICTYLYGLSIIKPPFPFGSREKWLTLVSPKNLKNSFDLHSLEDLSICLQTSLLLIQNKRHIYITIRTTCSSSNTPRRLIVFKHEEEPSPDLHSIYAHLINFHQKTSAQNPS